MLAEANLSKFTVKDVAPAAFIKAYADYLKKNDKVKLPKVNLHLGIPNMNISFIK